VGVEVDAALDISQDRMMKRKIDKEEGQLRSFQREQRFERKSFIAF
jgi:hypothetical protein